MEEEQNQMQVNKSGLPKSSVPFVVAVIMAVLIGGWLYVDIVRTDLQTQIDLLRISQSRVIHKVNGDKMVGEKKSSDDLVMEKKTELPVGWTSYEIEGSSKSFGLPPGYLVSVRESETFGVESLIIFPEPAFEGDTPLPVMTIGWMFGEEAPIEALNGIPYQESRGAVYIKSENGKIAYMFSLWENLAWEHFVAVVGTFSFK